MSSNLPRGLATLELLVRNVHGLPLHEIAQHLDLTRSTAHRVLAELVIGGYVKQDGDLSPYRPTLKVATLGLTYIANTGVADVVQPMLDKLASESGELARMSIVEGARLVWVAKAQGALGGLRLDSNSDPGEEVRLFCTSNGQAWLSCLSDEQALEIVSRQGFGKPGQFGPTAPRTIKAFLIALAAARKQGYAKVHDSYEVGVSALAAPVRSPNGKRVVGAVSIAGPTARLTPARLKKLLPLVLGAAKDLSSRGAEIRAFSA